MSYHDTLPYASVEQRLMRLTPEEMRAMLRSIFMELYPENELADGYEWDSDTTEGIGETFSCMGLAPPLKTEQDTPDMREQVEAAFGSFRERAAFEEATPTEVFFEHGQWWARFETGEGSRTFSVVDAEPGIDGFDFEET